VNIDGKQGSATKFRLTFNGLHGIMSRKIGLFTSMLAQAVKFLDFIREMTGLNLDQDTDYPE
jgi:hypothetical protein